MGRKRFKLIRPATHQASFTVRLAHEGENQQEAAEAGSTSASPDFGNIRIMPATPARLAGDVATAPENAQPEPVSKPPAASTTTFNDAKVETYDVHAASLSELAEIFSKKSEAGSTVPGVHWEAVYDAKDRIVSASVSVNPTITLPVWPEYSSATPAAKAEWDRVFKALRDHEDGHVAIVRQYATSLADSLVGKTRSDAEAAVQKRAQEMDTAGAQYDLETDHGKKTGTLINTSIQ